MRAFSLVFSTVLALTLVSSPPPAHAQDRDAARRSFQRGVSSYTEGNFSVALEAFQDAYRIAPHPSVRVNMANCYEQLGRPVEAVDHFSRFLIESPDAPADQTREIRATITRLRQTIGEVFLRVEPEGATITIDRMTILRAPVIDAIQLAEGAHRFEITADGFATVTREVSVDGGERQELRIGLTPSGETASPDPVSDGDPRTDPDPDPVDPDPMTAPDEPSSGGISPYVWIAGGVTLALGATAIGLGVSALGADSDFEQAVIDSNDPSLSRAERDEARQRGLDASDRASRRALVADILGGVAIAAAAGTVVLLFVTGGDDDEDDYATRVAPAVSQSGGGVQLEGSF